ncbi:L,D-transpeptidase [Streptomyces bathyalis]|uniref:L,D-transpeptidase n=1 Tax=Streptomyces bathyalis TaxID=2710756 RepID=A0A7T1WTM3_9ACTN|nr:L,D-transpeptidase [Streptomyces bathyalis]QPP06970.1 L,D-transpeptidase [Streptomyces bathyalis]
MARGSSAGAVVAALTAAALAVIGFFTYQASAAQDREKAGSSDSRGGSGGLSEREKKERETNLPAFSGAGERVVYDLDRNRVWLMGRNQEVKRTFRVAPSSVDPKPGTYKVESRAPHVTGSDGVPVENVVRFATSQGTTIGFSAALDGSLPDADPVEPTGGIRERRADGEAMWLFATIGTKVVVVR